MNFNIFFTNDCNMRCTYCYEGLDKKKIFITYEILDDIIEFIKEKVGASNSRVTITTHGGEPLLAFEKIKYFVEKIKKYDSRIRLQMTTNATLLDDQKIDFINKYYDRISISIDGNEEAHDANRRFANGKGSYEAVVNNVDKLFRKGIIPEARMTVNSNNYKYLSTSIIHLIEMGFKDILPVIDIFAGDWNEKMIADVTGEMLKVITYLKDNGQNNNITVGLIDTVKCKLKNSLCDGGLNTFTIDTDGKIYPCMLCNGNSKYCIGTVYSGINIQKLQEVHRSDKEIISICEGCTRYCYCDNTRCKIVNEIIMGDKNQPIPVKCAIENMCVILDEAMSS